MRILYFYQYFTTPAGAWSTRVYEFAQRCVAKGDSVTVVTSIYDKSDLRTEKWLERRNVDGIDVRIVNLRLSNHHGFAQRVFTFIAYALIASWYALTLPADVVVSSSGPISVAVPGLLARYIRRRRFVLEVRDLWPQGAIELGVLRGRLAIWLARRFERFCYKSASDVIALSEGSAEWIRRTYGFRHVRVIPNASDNRVIESVTELCAPPWMQGRKLVLYAGTIGVVNDCAQMVYMCDRLRREHDSGIMMVLIGEGRERPELEALARDLELDNIRFLGQMARPEMYRWLKYAQCTLMLVRNVGVLGNASPNKIFDSLAAGVPVVQNSQGWIKDLFDREECGLTVPPADPAALADAVRRIVCDSGLRGRLSVNARRVAREQFDRDLLAGKMRDALAAAAAGSR